MYNNDIRVANTATPLLGETNVSQYGWTTSDRQAADQMVTYVNEAKTIWNEMEEKLLYVENLVSQLESSGGPDGLVLSVNGKRGVIELTSGELGAASQENWVSVKDFGAKGDGITDDTFAFNEFAKTNKHATLPPGEYLASPIAFSKMSLSGFSDSKIKQTDTTGNHLNFRGPESGQISNLTVVSNKKDELSKGHQLALVGGNKNIVENLRFEGAKGEGFSLISYANPSSSKVKRQIVKSIIGEHTKVSSTNQDGCVLLSENECSVINGITASGYGQFGAFELKNTSYYNSISNIIGEDCVNTLYFGQQGGVGPKGNAVTNVVCTSPRGSGIIMGKSSYNTINNVVVDFSESTSSAPKIGVQIEDSNFNAVDNLVFCGVDSTSTGGIARPAHFRGTSKNNYIGLYSYNTTPHTVLFDIGTERNFCVIKQGIGKDDIFAPNVITNPSTVTGDIKSNVVHSPFTGQYFGTTSGRFEWRIQDTTIPSGVLVSHDKFRFISGGASTNLVVGGGDGARVKLFTSHGNSRSIYMNESTGILKMEAGGGTELWLKSDTLECNKENSMNIGSTGKPFAGGFVQTAFTVTSDERSKTTPLIIENLVLDAWGEVDWVQYQYLDRVEAKGIDGARYHLGVVAQRIVEAFERHGIDAMKYGLVCFDKWEATEEVAAGERYGVRYEEALALEAAYQRRRCERIEERLLALESK